MGPLYALYKGFFFSRQRRKQNVRTTTTVGRIQWRNRRKIGCNVGLFVHNRPVPHHCFGRWHRHLRHCNSQQNGSGPCQRSQNHFGHRHRLLRCNHWFVGTIEGYHQGAGRVLRHQLLGCDGHVCHRYRWCCCLSPLAKAQTIGHQVDSAWLCYRVCVVCNFDVGFRPNRGRVVQPNQQPKRIVCHLDGGAHSNHRGASAPWRQKCPV